MQLIAFRVLLSLLFVFALLGTAHAQPAPREIDVRASSELGTYADTNHVFVFTPTIAGTVAKPTAGWSLGGRYLVDVYNYNPTGSVDFELAILST